jgi:hypothetical protein
MKVSQAFIFAGFPISSEPGVGLLWGDRNSRTSQGPSLQLQGIETSYIGLSGHDSSRAPGEVGDNGNQLIRADRLRQMNLEARVQGMDAILFTGVSR